MKEERELQGKNEGNERLKVSFLFERKLEPKSY